MKIALMEPFPLLREHLHRALLSTPYASLVLPEAARGEKRYDLAVSDLNYFPPKDLPRAELYLIPGEARVDPSFREGVLLTGGMSRWDAVTLTSIRDNSAMLCLQREITLMGKSLVPCEKRIPYDRRMRLYKNLAIGFCLSLAEWMFEEE